MKECQTPQAEHPQALRLTVNLTPAVARAFLAYGSGFQHIGPSASQLAHGLIAFGLTKLGHLAEPAVENPFGDGPARPVPTTGPAPKPIRWATRHGKQRRVSA